LDFLACRRNDAVLEAERMAAASEYANEQALIFAGLGDKERIVAALDRMAALGAQRG
jgi:hypothetical protein